ncbi:MAG TPA: pimeloyl-ACP methyl esterase BioG family protein [Bacteroidales bacterium]|nr:pimeloyl-ACP methyl esterase BioG family protein [Bacteroidales bacterium]
MKTYIKRRDKNKELIVVYSAWGTDERMLSPLCDDDADFVLFYNYSADEALILPKMKEYDKITLIAWSLGVWAAEYLSPKTGIKPDVTIAVNGTPYPADEQYGIPLKIIEGTLNNITEETINKFYLRMFGDKKTFEANSERVPNRSLKSLHDELRWLYNRIMEQAGSGFNWNYAVISDEDRVFPSKNLKDFWAGQTNSLQINLPFPHYFFHKWDSFTGFVNFVEGYSSKEKTGQAEDLIRIRDL